MFGIWKPADSKVMCFSELELKLQAFTDQSIVLQINWQCNHSYMRQIYIIYIYILFM